MVTNFRHNTLKGIFKCVLAPFQHLFVGPIRKTLNQAEKGKRVAKDKPHLLICPFFSAKEKTFRFFILRCQITCGRFERTIQSVVNNLD